MIKINFPQKIKRRRKIIDHLKNNWSREHVLIKNQKLFDSLYKLKGNLNFLTLETKGKILSSIGLLFNNYKVSDLKKIFLLKNQVVWLTLWCTNKTIFGNDNLRLINFMIKKIQKNLTIATVGCNFHTYKIYKALGFKCGQLNHFYYLNKKKKTFNLVKNFAKNKIPHFKKKKPKLFYLNFKTNYKFIYNVKNYEKIYKKNFEYFKRKYYHNKFYKYNFLFIKNKDFLRGFFISREDKFSNYKCLRLIEYFGSIDEISNFTNDFQKLCEERNFEYIDFYNFGISKKKIISSGFKIKKITKKIIIPNYFKPFVQKNIKLRYAFYPSSEKMIFFKGDCDQDRPN